MTPAAMVQFFDFVALPLYQTMAAAFPGCTPLLENVRANYVAWAALEEAVADEKDA